VSGGPSGGADSAGARNGGAKKRRSDPADETFSPVEPINSGAVGPNSNTGQKGADHGALIDFLTVVIPSGRLEECSATDLDHLLPFIFGGTAELARSSRRGRGFNFYADSCLIFDREGENVGHIGLDGNGDTICISLSGAGCRWVRNWASVAHTLEILQARITRCDVAFDDYEGKLLNVHALRERAAAGEGFCAGGRPPKSRFLDDHGSGDGCSLYVGAKGHKELCIYEKGRQLGDETSSWTRAEVRFYSKHVGQIALDVLLRPMDYLRGAYPVLEEILVGACDRLTTVVAQVEATATAMVKWMRRQCGGAVHLLQQALGDDFAAYMQQSIARDRRPSRFARTGAAGDLVALVRNQLCPT
jgi:phage replication initiation protein